MQPRKSGPETGGWDWPRGAGPPIWLLPAGCTAFGLMLAGALLGGETGQAMAGLGCLALPTLVAVFFALLAWRSSGEGKDGPGAGSR
jgi:hypothetical protein